MAGVSCNAATIWPHVKGEVVTCIIDDGATEAFVKMSSSCSEIPNHAFDEEGLTKFKGGDYGPEFCFQSRIVQSKAQHQFLGCSTSRFNSVSSVNNDSPGLVDDKRCTWAIEDFDDDATSLLTSKLSDD
jgi:hypothetical protein